MAGNEKILDALRDVVEPQMGMNVVDLGMVYKAEEKGGEIYVAMTMITSACPVGDLLREEAVLSIKRQFPDAKSVKVELVWFPTWNAEMMSEDAKRQLARKNKGTRG